MILLFLGYKKYVINRAETRNSRVDTDNNGIRDDVEKSIDEAYKNDHKLRMAARQSAKVLQTVILDPDRAMELTVVMDTSFRLHVRCE